MGPRFRVGLPILCGYLRFIAVHAFPILTETLTKKERTGGRAHRVKARVKTLAETPCVVQSYAKRSKVQHRTVKELRYEWMPIM